MSTKTATERLAEAAAYALLRRLAPMLSHNMAGALQPLTMISTILERRLQIPAPDLAALAGKSSQLKTLTREATSACLNLVTWVAPDENELVPVAAAVAAAVALVMTELALKGFTIVNNVGDVQAELAPSLIRTVFMAALLALCDAAKAPADVVLEGQRVDSELVLRISIHSALGETMPCGLASYRNLDWQDVQALAEVNSVRFTHSANSVQLHFFL